MGRRAKHSLRFVIGVAQNEHAVQIVIPVAGNFIQVPLGHQGGSWSADSPAAAPSSSTQRCSSWMTRAPLGSRMGRP